MNISYGVFRWALVAHGGGTIEQVREHKTWGIVDNNRFERNLTNLFVVPSFLIDWYRYGV